MLLGFAAAWGLYFLEAGGHRLLTIRIFLGVVVIQCLVYLLLLRSPLCPLNWRQGAALVFAMTWLSPSFLETDQLRYIWDGLVQWQGVNPYRYAPAELLGDQNRVFAAINHKDLHTIYPPGAQILFALSAWMNPYFWGHLLPGPELLPAGPAAFWQYELGWKFLTGLLLAPCVWFWRGRRWDLVVAHPLFFFKGMVNAHVDILLVFFLAMALAALWTRRTEGPAVLALAGGILSKYLPLILLPLFIAAWSRRWGPARAASVVLLLTGVIALFVGLYMGGAEGHMFSSMKVYGDHWYFFGYVHRFTADLLAVTELSSNGIQAAKAVCALIGLVGAVGLFTLWYRQRISLRLACLGLITLFFILSPTLHPWYLLALFPVSLPYLRVLLTPVVWPALSLASVTFYVDNQDPAVIRWLVYTVVTFTLILDLRRLRRHIRPRLTVEGGIHVPA